MRIIRKQVLAHTGHTKIVRMDIHAPHIACKARPGQFVVVMVVEEGERIPLTIVDTNGEAVTVIFQEAGLSTKLLGKLKQGESLYAIVGPLGHATTIQNYGNVILVAGGVGIAEIYPVARALKRDGNRVVIVIGARTKEFLFLEQELREASDEVIVTTDDGSYGRKGFTTDVLKELLEKAPCQLVYAVGPLPMMKRSAMVTKPFGVKTIVSLNSIMLDGTGMCGGCRVTVDKNVKFACVDGPEFDAQAVDWDELGMRNKTYAEKEAHICRLHHL